MTLDPAREHAGSAATCVRRRHADCRKFQRPGLPLQLDGHMPMCWPATSSWMTLGEQASRCEEGAHTGLVLGNVQCEWKYSGV